MVEDRKRRADRSNQRVVGQSIRLAYIIVRCAFYPRTGAISNDDIHSPHHHHPRINHPPTLSPFNDPTSKHTYLQQEDQVQEGRKPVDLELGVVPPELLEGGEDADEGPRQGEENGQEGQLFFLGGGDVGGVCVCVCAWLCVCSYVCVIMCVWLCMCVVVVVGSVDLGFGKGGGAAHEARMHPLSPHIYTHTHTYERMDLQTHTDTHTHTDPHTHTHKTHTNEGMHRRTDLSRVSVLVVGPNLRGAHREEQGRLQQHQVLLVLLSSVCVCVCFVCAGGWVGLGEALTCHMYR
jgi:hypothetical protein